MLNAVLRGLMDWWMCQLAVHRLQVLDDRLLADMGMERKDIARLVAGTRDVC